MLDVGERLFAETPYEDVTLDYVAEKAGVSRALLYRHFPGKQAMFAAIYQRAAQRLLAETDFDESLPIAEQAGAALDAYLDYFAANANTVLAANVVLADDPWVQRVIAELLAGIGRRWADTNPADQRTQQLLSAAMSSWLAFVRELCVRWLQGRELSQTDVREISLGALKGALDEVPSSGKHRPARRRTTPNAERNQR